MAGQESTINPREFGARRTVSEQVGQFQKRDGFTYLYALVDDDGPPSPINTRYIGMTTQRPALRMHCHLQNWRWRKSRPETHRDRWIKKLLNFGREPRMHILASVPNEYAARAECRLIAAARNSGARLVNMSDGGEGSPGHPVSEEARRKISAANKGKGFPKSPEALAEMRRKLWLDPSARERQSRAMKRVVVTAERRRRVSKALKGRKLSEAHKAKLRVARRGRKYSEETRVRTQRRSSSAQRKFIWGKD